MRARGAGVVMAHRHPQLHREKVSALFQLYNEERRREDGAKELISQLSAARNDVLAKKLQLIQKLVDIQVKDELAVLRAQTNIGFLDASVRSMRKKAQRRLRASISQQLETSRGVLGDEDPAVPSLAELTGKTAEEDVAEVQQALQGFISGLVGQYQQQREAADGAAEVVVASEKERILQARVREMQTALYQDLLGQHRDKLRRVELAHRTLKKDAGDLRPLLALPVIPFDTDIGKGEAEVHRLKRQYVEQMDREDEMLRRAYEAERTLLTQREDLERQVEEQETLFDQMEREISQREAEIEEMIAACEPGTGKWDALQRELQEHLRAAIEEEDAVRDEYTALKKQLERLLEKRNALEAEVAVRRRDLQQLEEQNRQLEGQLDAQILDYKKHITQIRHKGRQHTQQINELRSRLGESVADLKRRRAEIRTAINQAIADILMEEQLQHMTFSRLQDLDSDTRRVTVDAEQHKQELRQQLEQAQAELQQREKDLQQMLSQLVDLRSGRAGKDKRASPEPLEAIRQRIEDAQRQWEATAQNTALRVAANAAKIQLTERANEQLLRKLDSIKQLRTDLEAEGVDLQSNSPEELQATLDRLKQKLSAKVYREGKLKLLRRMLDEHAQSGKPVISQQEKQRRIAERREQMRAALAIAQQQQQLRATGSRSRSTSRSRRRRNTRPRRAARPPARAPTSASTGRRRCRCPSPPRAPSRPSSARPSPSARRAPPR